MNDYYYYYFPLETLPIPSPFCCMPTNTKCVFPFRQLCEKQVENECAILQNIQ